MTRINLGINPKELCDKHLIAEYRELPRIRALALKHNGGPTPVRFSLGKGHMKFFIPYGATLKVRWLNLKAEMERRGFKPTLEWREYPTTLMNHVTKTHIAIARPLLQERIKQRLPSNARWTNAERPDWL